MREEFEKYAARAGIQDARDKNIAFFAWNSRQPEIDALKDEADRLREIIRGRTPAAYQILELERDALKAEVERIRADAEKSMSAHKTISDLMHDDITAMQAAFIEWRSGRGAEAGMEWIANTLSGPGLLPDENSPYGKEAQAWFDANKSNPFPGCFCGKPSHILWMGQGFCSEEHCDAAMKETKTQDDHPFWNKLRETK